MLLFLNKQLLCKCVSVSEKIAVINKLKEARIDFLCKPKGIGFGISPSRDRIFWFNIYVSKKDYEKASLTYKNSLRNRNGN